MGDPYDPITASVGDKLVFNFNKYHDVQKMKDDGCGPDGNTEVANNKVGGGEGDLTNKYTYTVTADDKTAGTIYFSCSYGPVGRYTHCTGGQKLTVTVVSDDKRVGACFTPKPGDTTKAPTTKAPDAVSANASRIGSAIAVVGAAMLAFFM